MVHLAAGRLLNRCSLRHSVLGIKRTKSGPVQVIRPGGSNGGMADTLVVQSLKEMRAEILGRIAAYEARDRAGEARSRARQCHPSAVHRTREAARTLSGQSRLLQKEVRLPTSASAT